MGVGEGEPREGAGAGESTSSPCRARPRTPSVDARREGRDALAAPFASAADGSEKGQGSRQSRQEDRKKGGGRNREWGGEEEGKVGEIREIGEEGEKRKEVAG